MDVIVQSSRPFTACHQESPATKARNIPNPPCVGDTVAYYSVTHRKWINTDVVRVRSDRLVDLACKKNVDVTLLTRLFCMSESSKPDCSAAENPSPVHRTSSTSVYAVGAKVEYFSESVNGWIQSVVRGHNQDGSYHLNTKKSAPASRVRVLIPKQPSDALDKPSSQLPFLTVVNVDGHSMDLESQAARVLGALNLTFDHTVSRMKGLTGGQNEGIYFVSGPPNNHRKLCLKVVRSSRHFPSVQTERERYIEILRFHSATLLQDKHICFPIRILQLACNQSVICDVVVMKCAEGERMAEMLARLVSASDWSGLASVFERVGAQLKKFHHRYKGMQHGDLQVSNIYVNSKFVVFIDVGGMGRSGNDVEYFLQSILILAKTYGPEFQRIASSSFNRGYSIN